MQLTVQSLNNLFIKICSVFKFVLWCSTTRNYLTAVFNDCKLIVCNA